MHSEYHSRALKVSLISIAVNLFLVAVKLIIGFASNSMAVIADALHSFSDVATTIILIVSLVLSRKPADSLHPFGHGRSEDIGGLFMSLLLGGAGITLGFKSWQRMFHEQAIIMPWGFILLILFTALVKLWLGLFTHRTAVDVKSDVLRVDAFHHHADFVTSILVVTGMILVKKGLFYVDGILGLAVSGLIIVWGGSTLKKFIDNLIGKTAPQAVYDRIRELVLSFPQVQGVHDIFIHAYGRYFVTSLHIEVPQDLSLSQAHDVADSIERKIEGEELGKCIVHVDVGSISQSDTSVNVEKYIRQFMKKNPCIRDFHNVEVINAQNVKMLSLHLQFKPDISLDETHRICHKAEQFIISKTHISRVNIHIEPYRHQKKEAEDGHKD